MMFSIYLTEENIEKSHSLKPFYTKISLKPSHEFFISLKSCFWKSFFSSPNSLDKNICKFSTLKLLFSSKLIIISLASQSIL